MLTITIPEREFLNEETMEFFTIPGTTLRLEHSLVSLAKWESTWKKPFLGKEKKTLSETLDYIRCMTITQNVSDEIYYMIDNKTIEIINSYIEDPMTATTFNIKNKPDRSIITAEIIYYWMIALNIPFECQKWHLSRLLALINVCNIKNQPKKKSTRADFVNARNELNAQRRAQLGSKG